MVIKVDFDLTMSILTHNIFRLFANDTDRYKHISDNSIYEKFLRNSADIIIDDAIEIKLKKKFRNKLISFISIIYHPLW